MNPLEPIQIPIGKTKVLWMLLISVVFVALGILFFSNPEGYRSSIFQSVIMIRISGAASILFFGYIGIYLAKKLGDKSSGLIIINEGITDNSGATSIGFIPWKDISSIKETMAANQKFAVVILKDPQQYIDKQPNALKRKIMTANYKYYESPVSISANGLKCDHQYLMMALNQGFRKFNEQYSHLNE